MLVFFRGGGIWGEGGTLADVHGTSESDAREELAVPQLVRSNFSLKWPNTIREQMGREFEICWYALILPPNHGLVETGYYIFLRKVSKASSCMVYATRFWHTNFCRDVNDGGGETIQWRLGGKGFGWHLHIYIYIYTYILVGDLF